MQSFEDLGLTPELVEVLAAEGLEVPTAFQAEALPLIRRGTSLLGASGPGSGTLVAYGAALLDRIEAGGGTPKAIVVASTADAADRLAHSLARLARATGHQIGALGSPWALPERADILFATADDLLLAVRESRVKLDTVETFVMDGASVIDQLSGLDAVKTVIDFLPPDTQRIILSLPLSPAVAAFAQANLKRAVHLPPSAATGEPASSAPERGEVRFQIISEEKAEEVLEVIAPLLSDEVHHALIFFRTEDQAADIGDHLTLHGFEAGAPGDADVPIWLGFDELEARAVLQGFHDPSLVATLSFDVPPDADSLDRRHGSGAGGTILTLARELPHLKSMCAEAGYRLLPAPSAAPPRMAADLALFRDRIEAALREEDLTPHLLILEPLFKSWSAAEVAAAAAALLRRAGRTPSGLIADEQQGSGAVRPSATRAPAWVHLFISLGEKDGVKPGDLVGAVAGEAGIPGSKIGKIEIRDTFSRVEVEESVAAQVVKALNGVTIRGRSIRADYDRKDTKDAAKSPGGTRPGPRQRRSLASDARGRPGAGGSDAPPRRSGPPKKKPE